MTAEVPFSSAWKWSGITLGSNGAPRSYVIGAPDVLAAAGALTLPPACRTRSTSTRSPGVGWWPSARRPAGFRDPARQPPPQLQPLALVVLEERLRPDAAETVEFMRAQQVDLKLISGDARADGHRRGEGRRRAGGRPG